MVDRGRHEKGGGKPSYPTVGPQTGTGKRAIGRKPRMQEIRQRGADGSILKRLSRKIWGWSE